MGTICWRPMETDPGAVPGSLCSWSGHEASYTEPFPPSSHQLSLGSAVADPNVRTWGLGVCLRADRRKHW